MDFREQLKRANLKATPKRLQLLRLLQDSPPLAVPALHAGLGGDLSTLYRNLRTLCDRGLIQRLLVEGEARFQPNTHQHFIVCKACHRLEPLPICPIKEELGAQLQRQSGFTMTEHKLELYGYCSQCAKRPGE